MKPRHETATQVRDRMRDVLALIDVTPRTTRVVTIDGHDYLSLEPMLTATAARVANLLTAGARLELPTRGAVYVDDRSGRVGEVITTGPTVCLQCLVTGERWATSAVALRQARYSEIVQAQRIATLPGDARVRL